MTKTLYKFPAEQLERIVREYEAAPPHGNSVDEMLRRSEYILAVGLLEKERERQAADTEKRRTLLAAACVLGTLAAVGLQLYAMSIL